MYSIHLSKITYEQLIQYLKELKEENDWNPKKVAWDIIHLILELKVEKNWRY